MNNIKKGYKKILKTYTKKQLINQVLDLTDENANISLRCEELYDGILDIQNMVKNGEIFTK